MSELLSMSSAFELLRSFKEVSPETERLVLAIVRRQHSMLTINELIKIFENGITGQYGKVYTLDPQTILSWIEKYEASKNDSKNYRDTPLYPVNRNGEEVSMDGWRKEANKCYTAFLNGVSHEYFHAHVYDRMLLDDKIKPNSYKKHCKDQSDIWEVNKAQRMILRDIFLDYKDRGYAEVYFISK